MRTPVLRNSLLLAFISALICVGAQSIPFSGAGILWLPNDLYLWVERVGFISGVVGVYLMVKRSWVNYPVGLIWAVAYAVYYFAVARHFGEMALMVVNGFYLIDGWNKWARKESEPDLPITRLDRHNWFVILATIAIIYPAFVVVLHSIRGNFVYFDGATTAISFVAQYLTNRKKIESRIFWIAADLVIAPVFFYRGFYATAILITIFTVMGFVGWIQWRRAMAEQDAGRSEGPDSYHGLPPAPESDQI